jgi:hypothetical protein
VSKAPPGTSVKGVTYHKGKRRNRHLATTFYNSSSKSPQKSPLNFVFPFRKLSNLSLKFFVNSIKNVQLNDSMEWTEERLMDAVIVRRGQSVLNLLWIFQGSDSGVDFVAKKKEKSKRWEKLSEVLFFFQL